ncbi:MAG: type I-E CRISPR-associated protein Cse1/CasA [Fibrobacter sp.]|nr:type I-E CRISPR-associated protein Cse1/CasA [Fibrobacter sp.]
MNILSDSWLPVIRDKNKTKSNEDTISIYNLLSDYEVNPVVDIVAPRPDLRNAIYQLFIGIVQVVMTPQSPIEWAKQFDSPPNEEKFKELLDTIKLFFEIDNSVAAFMQDLELKEGEEKPIASIFIESPGAKTIKDNLDHFVKRDTITTLDPYWAAIALYTLQTFAPSGGVGHRVGVRGGGPLTTMVIPLDKPEHKVTLWEKLWTNILTKSEIESTCKAADFDKTELQSIFPWLKPSKISEGKGTELYPQECNPLHVYFAMPRRIRLVFSDKMGVCSLTGKECQKEVTGFITKNYGNNYSGPWIHPLNPYRIDMKNTDEPPLSIKGQPGGVHYRHWLGLTVGYADLIPASVLHYIEQDLTKRVVLRKKDIVLWAAGYDMDNMKARSWHESTMPYYVFDENADLSNINAFKNDVRTLIETSGEIIYSLRSAVRKAWFKDPSSPTAKKADFSFLENAFTQNTEQKFYSVLNTLYSNITSQTLKDIRAAAGKEWHQCLQRECLKLFEQWCFTSQDGQKDLKKIFQIRKELINWILFGKEIKLLKLWYDDTVDKEIKDKNKSKKKKQSSKGGPDNDR